MTIAVDAQAGGLLVSRVGVALRTLDGRTLDRSPLFVRATNQVSSCRIRVSELACRLNLCGEQTL
jgi:hypothetical protein